MHTKNKYRNNLQELIILLHHCQNGSKKQQTYKVWICQSVGKLKGVGHQAKSKMKDLIIQKITDLQLHIRHHGIPKVQI